MWFELFGFSALTIESETFNNTMSEVKSESKWPISMQFLNPPFSISLFSLDVLATEVDLNELKQSFPIL